MVSWMLIFWRIDRPSYTICNCVLEHTNFAKSRLTVVEFCVSQGSPRPEAVWDWHTVSSTLNRSLPCNSAMVVGKLEMGKEGSMHGRMQTWISVCGKLGCGALRRALANASRAARASVEKIGDSGSVSYQGNSHGEGGEIAVF